MVRIYAAGVNPPGCQDQGWRFKLILPYRLPLILGNDVAGVVPVMDRVFPFENTIEALAYVETGRAKGKVVIAVQ